VVGPSGVEFVVGLVPGERGAADVLDFLVFDGLVSVVGVNFDNLVHLLEVVLEHGGLSDFLDVLGAGEIEDLDTFFGSDNNPVEFLGEENAVDW